MSYSSAPNIAPGTGRRLVYSLLSALIPGVGQILAGNQRRGIAMLAVTLVLIASAIYVYMQGQSTLLSWLVRPRILIIIFVLNLVVLLFRIGAVVDAYLSSHNGERSTPRRWHSGIVALVLALVLTFTAAPHAVIGYYTYLTHDTLTTVFSRESLVEMVPTPTPEPTIPPDQDSAETSSIDSDNLIVLSVPESEEVQL